MFTDALTPSSFLVADRQARYRREAQQHRLVRRARRARDATHQTPPAE
jgi:hypothetical protein